MRRAWIPLILIVVIFLFGCRLFFVTMPESADPSEIIEIVVDLMGEPNLPSNGDTYTPVVCLGRPASWSIVAVNYAGMTNSTVQAFGTPSYSLSNSTWMDSNYPLSFPSELGDWNCYLGPETSYTPDANGSVTIEAQTGLAGAVTIYVSAGDEEVNGPDYAIIEKRISVGGALQDLEHWVKADVSIQTNVNLTGIAHGGGNYVAVGSELWLPPFFGFGSYILNSTNGRTWSEVSGLGSSQLQAVHFADGRFVAVGQNGQVLTSATGESWQGISTPASNTLFDVTYGNGTWVAVGNNSAFWATDINSWSATDLLDISRLQGVEYIENLFVAVGYSNANTAVIYTSPNGSNWTKVEDTIFGVLYDVAFGNGRYVATGNTNIYYSDNGSTWNTTTNPIPGAFLDLVWHDGSFVAVGSEGALFTSPDGMTWTGFASGTGVFLQDVIHDGNRFIAVGDDGLIILSNSPSGGGGGGGGGCNTAGPGPGEPLWPEALWLVLLGGILIVMRRRSLRN
ncbi:hypothetical protein MUP29_10320 [bacterium]|nr:hypothetical protein [bacterium]